MIEPSRWKPTTLNKPDYILGLFSSGPSPGLLVCLFFTLPNWYAVVPAFAYAIIHTRGNLAQVSFQKIEEKFPEFNEQLITVADNWKDDNPVVEQLNAEVLQKMKNKGLLKLEGIRKGARYILS